MRHALSPHGTHPDVRPASASPGRLSLPAGAGQPGPAPPLPSASPGLPRAPLPTPPSWPCRGTRAPSRAPCAPRASHPSFRRASHITLAALVPADPRPSAPVSASLWVPLGVLWTAPPSAAFPVLSLGLPGASLFPWTPLSS